jgi:hypothetical protein
MSTADQTLRALRKYVYGKTREEVHDKWIKLHAEAEEGPVATSSPTLARYLARWLREVAEPDLKPRTAETHAMHVRLYIAPGLGSRRLDKLTVRDVRNWVNALLEQCRCCAQGLDEKRDTPRCCAAGDCCERIPSRRTVQDARTVPRSALTNAMTEELISIRATSTAGLSIARPAQESAGFGMHDTRHTSGSLLAALDVHPRVAMQILPHGKIAVPMEVYTHVPSESTRRALRKLGKQLGRQDRK